MATYTYTVVEQEAEPTIISHPDLGNGFIWVKPSVKTIYIYLNGMWIPFAGA